MAQPQGVSLAFAQNTLATAPVWTRLDDPALQTLVASYQIDRGRPTETQRTSGGTATVTINDRQGLLDPTNPSGPHFGNIEPLMQAAIARWNPITASWDTRFRGFVAEWDYQFDPSQRVNQLQLSLVDIFEILESVEMYASPGTVYFGDAPPAGSEGQIAFWSNQLAHDRIVQILGQANIPAEMYVVFSLNVKVATGFATDGRATIYSPGETALAAIQETVDAEFPELANAYTDRFGRFVVHGRQAVFDPVGVASGVSSAVWDWHHWHAGDGDAVNASPATVAQIRQFAFNHGRQYLTNTALAYPVGASDTEIAGQTYPAVGVSSASRTKYGFRSWSAPNLLTLQGEYAGGVTTTALVETKRFAQYKVANYQLPIDRITTLGFRPKRPGSVGGDVVHLLLGKVDISDQIDVTINSPGGGGFNGAVQHWFVQGVHESCAGRLRDGVAAGAEGYDDVTLTLDVSPGPSDTSMFPP